VNSFGFGGTNSHAILDDALHYLLANELKGNHCTAAAPSLPTEGVQSLGYPNGVANGVTNGATNDGRNGIANGVTNGATNGITNGFSNHSKPSTATLNSTPNGHLVAEHPPRLLVWSAADEKTLDHIIHDYQAYHEKHVQGNLPKLDKLAYTLAAKRTPMLWRTFGLVSPSSGPTAFTNFKPLRSSSHTGIAFVFTGQGAQYVNMGVDLVKFPVYEETLTRADNALAQLGCKWSLFSKFTYVRRGGCQRFRINTPVKLRCDVRKISITRHTASHFARHFRFPWWSF
jgi:acyl transferase domain-containing protein